jgi:hypothetical protein
MRFIIIPLGITLYSFLWDLRKKHWEDALEISVEWFFASTLTSFAIWSFG